MVCGIAGFKLGLTIFQRLQQAEERSRLPDARKLYAERLDLIEQILARQNSLQHRVMRRNSNIIHT